MPRKVSKHFKTMGYILLRKCIQLNGIYKNKYLAFCTICGKELANTSKNRLGAHRNVCALTENNFDNNSDEDCGNSETLEVEFITSEPVTDVKDISIPKYPTAELDIDTFVEYFNKGCNKDNIDFVVDMKDCVPKTVEKRKTITTNELKNEAKKRKSTHFSTYNSKIEKSDIDEAIGKFFFGCNIPFSVIESNHFKNLINTLCPNYTSEIPDKSELEGNILEKEYLDCVEESAQSCEKHSVLLLDSWESVLGNSKTFVILINNNRTENHIFLNSKEVPISTPEKEITQIIDESREIANAMYQTEVFAVVAENAINLQNMDAAPSLWYINCNIQTANLLTEDIYNNDKMVKSCLEKAKLLIKHDDLQKYFKTNDFDVSMLNCCSYRHFLLCIKNNLSRMRETVATSKYKIDPEIGEILFDNNLEKDCKECLKLLDPVYKLINEIETTKCNLSDSVDLWNDLAANDIYRGDLNSFIESRCQQSLSTIALTAYYFDPRKKMSNLTEHQQNKVNSFLLEELSANGIDEWTTFQEKTDIFDILFKKQLHDPIVFWKTAKLKAPTLSNLALKCLQIPASCVQIKKLISNFSDVHSSMKNAWSQEQSIKLINVYYALKMKEKCNIG